jgi:hypothetical protein
MISLDVDGDRLATQIDMLANVNKWREMAERHKDTVLVRISDCSDAKLNVLTMLVAENVILERRN